MEIIADVIVTELKVRRELGELFVLINLNLKSNMILSFRMDNRIIGHSLLSEKR